jgi:hypothetical protein
MPKLSSEQKKIAKQLIRIGKKRGESPKDIVTALATGLVESNLTNPHGGDAHSEGWRQERRMYYPNPTNVKASANRFYNELDSVGPGSIGERAQGAQQSAFPGRYSERVGEAREILKQLNRGAQNASQRSKRQAGQNAGPASLARTQTIPGPGLSRLAVLDFIQNRNEPGAIVQFAKEKKSAEATTKISVQSSNQKQTPKRTELKYKEAYKEATQTYSKDHLPIADGAIHVGTAVAKKFGLTVTSTTGGSHVPGSYHYSGRAIDISGDSKQMAKAYRYIRKNVPHAKLTELFYDPAGVYFDNGQKVKGAIGGHSDHIHLAI